jgi:hypothetical protein
LLLHFLIFPPENSVISEGITDNGTIELVELSIANITLLGSIFYMTSVIYNPTNQTIIESSPNGVYPFETLVVVKPNYMEYRFYGASFSTESTMSQDYHFYPGNNYITKKFFVGLRSLFDGEYYFEVIYRSFSRIPCDQVKPVYIEVKDYTIKKIIENYPRNNYSDLEFTITNVTFIYKENIDDYQKLTLDVTFNTNYEVYPRTRCEIINFYPKLTIFTENRTEGYSSNGYTDFNDNEITLKDYVIKKTQTKRFSFFSNIDENSYTQFPDGKLSIILQDTDNYLSEENSNRIEIEKFNISNVPDKEISNGIEIEKSNITNGLKTEIIDFEKTTIENTTDKTNRYQINEFSELIKEFFTYIIAGGAGSFGGILLAIVISRKQK